MRLLAGQTRNICNPLQFSLPAGWSIGPSTQRKTVLEFRAHRSCPEGEMTKLRSFVRSHRGAASLLSVAVLCTTLSAARFLRAQSDSSPAPLSDAALIAEFRRVEVASVSDALEQL